MEKKLHRISQQAVLGGVAAGLGQYFAIDAVILRVLFFISLFFSFGTSVLAYIVLWAVLPDGSPSADQGTQAADPDRTWEAVPAPGGSSAGDRNIKVIAIALLAIGGFMLLDDVIEWYQFRKYFWPLAFIAVGAFLLLRRRDEQAERQAPIITPPPADPSPETPASDAPTTTDAATDAGKQDPDSDGDDVIKVN